MFFRRAITLVPILAVIGGLLILSAPQASAVPDKYALIIGVARFHGKTPPLPGADGDAHDTRQFFLNSGWSSQNIRTLVNFQATAAAIRDGMQWLAAKCSPNTECAFKYSGHVAQTQAADRDSERIDENLWTSENAYISDGEVAGYLKQIKGRAWIDVSGCEAAGFDDNVSSSLRVFTASSQEHEKSYESPVYKNSVWTELLVNQGLAQGKNLYEAFNYAKPRAARETQNQRKGAQNAYIAGGDPASWFNRGPAAAPRQSSQCLLGLICL